MLNEPINLNFLVIKAVVGVYKHQQLTSFSTSSNVQRAETHVSDQLWSFFLWSWHELNSASFPTSQPPLLIRATCDVTHRNITSYRGFLHVSQFQLMLMWIRTPLDLQPKLAACSDTFYLHCFLLYCLFLSGGHREGQHCVKVSK